MKNRKTNEPLVVIVFTLVPKDEIEKLGSKAEDKSAAAAPSSGGGDDDVD